MNIIMQLLFGKPETVRLHTKINWVTKKNAKYRQELKQLALHLLAQCANSSCSASRHMLKQYAYMLPKRVNETAVEKSAQVETASRSGCSQHRRRHSCSRKQRLEICIARCLHGRHCCCSQSLGTVNASSQDHFPCLWLGQWCSLLTTVLCCTGQCTSACQYQCVAATDQASPR